MSATSDRENAWVRYRGMCTCLMLAAAACGNPPIEVPVHGAVQIAAHPDNADTEQVDTIAATLMPYRVLVTDIIGRPVAGVQVRWAAHDSSWHEIVTVTDAGGVAAYAVTLGVTAGVYRTSAAAAGLAGSPVMFSATALPGKPVALTVVHGNDQIGVTGGRLGRYVVEALDRHDNAVSGVLVEWSVPDGHGTLDSLRSVTSADSAAGMIRPAAMAVHTLGAYDGVATVTARSPDLPAVSHVTFTSIAAAAIVFGRTSGEGCWDYYENDSCQPRFEPQDVEIARGRTVAWAARPCDVTFEDDPLPPASAPGGSRTHTRRFDSTGTYRYRCGLHSENFTVGMVGAVHVR